VRVGSPGRGVERLVLDADTHPRRIDRAAQAALGERDPWVSVPTTDPGRTGDRLAEHGLRSPAVPEWLMSVDLAGQARRPLSEHYGSRLHEQAGVWRLTIVDRVGAPAASGQLAVVDGCAVPDRVETLADHRRRGLGAATMAALAQVALDAGASYGLLMASAQGRRLYARLGWATHQPVVIGRLW
jgi:GNAT superfamily N-acetyltransferase